MHYTKLDQLLLSMDDATRSAIEQITREQHFAKGELLLREGQVSRRSFQLTTGIARRFSVHEGQVKTTEFYFADDLAISFSSYVLQIPSRESIECLTPVSARVVEYEAFEKAKQAHPRLVELDLHLTELYAIWQEERLWEFRTLSAQQRYEKLMKQAPELLQQVQLTHIASYLGLSLETLSRIRARL
jgi:CRP-like cAMP-binding protein